MNVWLVNTGWSGGAFGVGKRMKLSYTRAMITAALNGALEKVDFVEHPVFGLKMPTTCPEVPSAILNPRNTWSDQHLYETKANELAIAFIENFKQFDAFENEEMQRSLPKINEITV